MIHKLSRNRSIAYLLIVSFFFTFLTPMTASAGVLGSVLNFIKPHAKILGNIGGAIAGASMGSAFCPPLGTIAGGILGYVVGGSLASYAAGGLSNVATIAGAAAGYVAMSSMGPVGMVAGMFLGGLVGKVAYSLLKKVDNSVTGGLVFAPVVEDNKTSDSTKVSVNSTNVVLSSEIPASSTDNKTTYKAQQPSVSNSDISVQEATEKYNLAYQKYITAARDSANSGDLNEAYKEYQEAYETYKRVTGK